MQRYTLILVLAMFIFLGSSGVCWSDERPIDEQAATAFKEWAVLAEQGDDLAQNMLGNLYGDGYGDKRHGRAVPQDWVLAYMWYSVSALTNGRQDVIQNRDRAQSRLTPSELVEATTLAAECISKNYKGCGRQNEKKRVGRSLRSNTKPTTIGKGVDIKWDVLESSGFLWGSVINCVVRLDNYMKMTLKQDNKDIDKAVIKNTKNRILQGIELSELKEKLFEIGTGKETHLGDMFTRKDLEELGSGMAEGIYNNGISWLDSMECYKILQDYNIVK